MTIGIPFAAAVIGAALMSTPAEAGKASRTMGAKPIAASATMAASNIVLRDHRGPRGIRGGGVKVSTTVNCVPRHSNDKRCRNAVPVDRSRR